MSIYDGCVTSMRLVSQAVFFFYIKMVVATEHEMLRSYQLSEHSVSTPPSLVITVHQNT